MIFQIVDDDGSPLDAHVELEGREIVFHSRGGARGDTAVRNHDYGPGLRLILERLRAAGLQIQGAWVDSTAVRHLPEPQRAIFDPADRARPPAEQFRILSGRMKEVGRASTRPGGNSTKRIRIALEAEPAGLADLLRVQAVRRDTRSQQRLPAEMLGRVTSEHVWRAAQRLLEGADHPFGASTDFDLLADDGVRLPPKAVFGLAATEALGFPVMPLHFTGGLGTPSFRALEAAGFEIVAKDAASRRARLPASEEDRAWAEGRPRLVRHLQKERAAGLSRAKKAAFIREHGRLHCERCGLDPQERFPELGEACIEAHHHVTRVEQMDEDHQTRLEDLQCLCANCHRVVHALLRRQVRAAG